MNSLVLKSILILILLHFTACIVQSPKYSTLEKVMSLKVGMSKFDVEAQLGLKPYNIKAINDTSQTYIYIYRLKDRKTLPFNTKALNGKEVIGKYVQLAITFSTNNKLMSVESCVSCPDNLVTTSKIDIEKVIVFITVTVPVLLIYFGLKN